MGGRGVMRNLQALLLGGHTSGPAPKTIPTMEEYVRAANSINAPATAQAQQIAELSAIRSGIRKENAQTAALETAANLPFMQHASPFSGPSQAIEQPAMEYNGPTQADSPNYAVDPYAGFYEQSKVNPQVQATLDAQLLRSAIERDPLAFHGAASATAQKYLGRSAPSEQDYAVYQQSAKAEAAQRANLQKWMRQPGVTDSQKVEAWMQHEQQYGDVINNPAPPSQAELEQQRQAAELEQYQAQTPDVPLLRNSKGEIGVMPGFSEAVNARTNMIKAQKELTGGPNLKEAYQAELKLVESADPDEPGEDAATEDWDFYRAEKLRNRKARRQVFQKYYGDQQQQQSSAPAGEQSESQIDPVQFEKAQKISQSSGLELVVDQADFDELPSKAFYIDAMDGKQYQKP